MHTRTVFPVAVFLCALLAACGESVQYAYLSTPGAGDRYVAGSLDPGSARLKPDLCRDVPENSPDRTQLDENALVAFLQHQGFHTKVLRARSDLAYVDVLDAGGSEPVRLRVAILPDAYAAGSDLHNAILEHGPGSWGIHRSNLAILAPIGSMDQILELAGRTKLACWGVLTVAARDDDFVVPGGYMEF
jgi:hypothetical protein